MTRLTPSWLRLWRCRCGARHDSLISFCPYTNIPRDWL